ncbi:KEOPS complex subunit Cgi121 [Halorussus gelatinilyticus]|uniref:KEOPS complex subunit Cgi121 n=1 Tax=Halorussus gelatinilyticus TaxID=2937524 RepID=A0A8U0IMX6_9EURY|nr:KEOPS complex subunit Cgi121 [Halorussus gelatinilyticus]UPW01792.1 KEOPS complex subunit Cgi121 [Halorussus gelatinilyticus]
MKLVEGSADIEDLDAFLGDIGHIGDEFDCAIQAFDADYVLGEDHLRTAVERADRAFERGENVARERAVEILLYAAGRRQIDRALRMGVGVGETDAVVVVHSPDGDDETERAAAEAVGDLLVPASASADAGADDDPLAADRIDAEAVRDFFDVSETELAATDATLADLVRERVALLDVEK